MADSELDNLPDAALVLAATLGDLRSFDTLALRYRAAAYRVAQTITGNELAEDIVQEALLLAFKALPSLEEPDKFAAWLYAITRHAAYRLGQKSRRERLQRVALDEALLENSAALTQPFKPHETMETAACARRWKPWRLNTGWFCNCGFTMKCRSNGSRIFWMCR